MQQVSTMLKARALESAGPPLEFRVGARDSLDLRRVDGKPRQKGRRNAERVRLNLKLLFEPLDLAQHLCREQAAYERSPPSVQARGPRRPARAACREVRQTFGAAALSLSANSNKPLRSTSRCPARLPLSTVETYSGRSGFRERVSYQL